MGALIPSTVDGLIVCEKGISVTNIVNGTTRLQPVVLLTGQAAGMLAAKSILLKKKIRDVPVRSVQEELLKVKCYLMPFSDVKPDDPAWEAIQRVGLTGILKGIGKSEGWANKMYFYPDSLVRSPEAFSGFRNYRRQVIRSGHRIYKPPEFWTIKSLFSFLNWQVRNYIKQYLFIEANRNIAYWEKNWENWGLTNFNQERFITRRELCIILDKCILLFGSKYLILDSNGVLNFVSSQ
jgi:hypothetical protein